MFVLSRWSTEVADRALVYLAWRVAGIALAISGCSGSVDPLGFALIQVTKPGRTTCIQASRREGDVLRDGLTDALGTGKYRLDVSVLRRADGVDVGEGNLRDWVRVCTLTVPASESSAATTTSFRIPTDSTAPTTLRMEVYDKEGADLKFSGQTHDVELAATEDVTIYLHPAGARSCLERKPWASAFHSATLLPNGQVVLVGGLRGSGEQGAVRNGEFFVQDAVGVFDPSTLDLRVACPVPQGGSDELSFPGRAFHEAVLLPGPARGPYRILLLGGIDADQGRVAARERRPETNDQPMRINPTEASRAAGPGILVLNMRASTGCDEEGPLATYEPLPELDELKGLFPAVALSDDGTSLTFVGGATSYTPSGEAQGFAVADRPSSFEVALEGVPRIIDRRPLRRVRAGHAVVSLGDAGEAVETDRFFVLGGTMDGSSAELLSQHGEEVSASQVSSTARAIEGSAAVTAGHTLTPIGLSEGARRDGEAPRRLLWFGGFELKEGRNETYRFAVDPQPRTAQLLNVETDPFQARDAGAVGGPALETTVFHHALELGDGRVLISGGNVPKARCQVGAEQKQLDRCAVDQLAVLALNGDRVERVELPLVPSLQFARYGHTSTRLLDGTVVIMGGLGVDPATLDLSLLGQHELINLLRGGPADSPFAGPPEQASCELQ